MEYDAQLDATQGNLEEVFLKLKEMLASKLGSDVSIIVQAGSQADAKKVQAFASMSGCQTSVDKRDEWYIIHITGSPCCA